MSGLGKSLPAKIRLFKICRMSSIDELDQDSRPRTHHSPRDLPCDRKKLSNGKKHISQFCTAISFQRKFSRHAQETQRKKDVSKCNCHPLACSWREYFPDLFINYMTFYLRKKKEGKCSQENIFLPFPVVWSADGPVRTDGVLPLRRVQSNLSFMS